MSTSHPANIDLAAALAEAQEQYRARNPGSLAIHEEACAALPGGNTRSAIYAEPFPLTMVRGDGAHLWDADGHEYVDGVLQRGAVQCGQHLPHVHLVAHGHPDSRHGAGHRERRALLVDPLRRPGEVQRLLHVAPGHSCGAERLTLARVRDRPGDDRAAGHEDDGHGERHGPAYPAVLRRSPGGVRHPRLLPGRCRLQRRPGRPGCSKPPVQVPTGWYGC